jgi:hypothetical protein
MDRRGVSSVVAKAALIGGLMNPEVKRAIDVLHGSVR